MLDLKEEKIKYFEVVEIQEMGEGTRVCLDFIDVIEPNEGVFIGNTSQGYIFILSENREAKEYKPRPFRVNVGAINQYVLLGEKTAYLSDMNVGDKIPVYSEEEKREVVLGRKKLEKRNFLRVVTRTGDIEISVNLQNAESVYVYEESKGIVSINCLEIGDKVKVYIDKMGRHLGNRVEEYIVEK